MIIKKEKSIRTIRGNVRQVVQPLHVVLEAVKALESGEMTINEAMKKYDVKRKTIINWLERHSEQYNRENGFIGYPKLKKGRL